MKDEELNKQIDEVLKDHTPALLYRLERLEERNGRREPAPALRRLPCVESRAEQDLVKDQILARIEILEKMYGLSS